MKKRIQLKMADGICEAFEVTPEEGSEFPAVLFYMDAIGIRDSLLDLAQRIADGGFKVLVPNLFYRDQALPMFDYPKIIDEQRLTKLIFPTLTPWMQRLTPDALLEDASVYVNHLSPVAVVGYCMGGAHAVRTAAKFTEIKGVVSLHAGRLADDHPKAAIHFIKDLNAKLYFGHADHDQSMTLPQILKFEAELKKRKKNFVSEIYSGAEHGWTQTDLPAYHYDASEKAFKKTMTLLADVRP
jgi:carboxymethylenebutenolidase